MMIIPPNTADVMEKPMKTAPWKINDHLDCSSKYTFFLRWSHNGYHYEGILVHIIRGATKDGLTDGWMDERISLFKHGILSNCNTRNIKIWFT